MKPFLKWAGGKSKIVPEIVATLPPNLAQRRLVEPFLGSAAVFMGVEAASYLLADTNHDLISLYRLVRDHGSAFVERCDALFNLDNLKSEAFYDLRKRFNILSDVVMEMAADEDVAGENASEARLERAALFIYLNRNCFNGLCRYNASGGFNVPYGRNSTPYFPRQEMLAFAEKAKASGAVFVCRGFEATMAEVSAGDVVYCDPPYSPLSETASFDSYAKEGFSQAAHERLAEACRMAAGRGATVLVSNHFIKPGGRGIATCDLYHGCSGVRTINVRRSISGAGDRRGKAPEALVLFNPAGEALPAVMTPSEAA